MISDDELGVRDVVRLGVAAAVAAVLPVLLAAAGLWWHAQVESRAATAVAAGQVVAVDAADVRVTVAWRDDAGTERRSDLVLYDVDDAPVGTPLEVRYDPADPDDDVFAVQPDLAVAPGEDALYTGLLIGLVGALLLTGWAVRLQRNGRALSDARSGAPGQPMRLLVLSGSSNGVTRPYAVLVPDGVAAAPPREDLELLLDVLVDARRDDDADELDDDEDDGDGDDRALDVLIGAPERLPHQPVLYEPVLDEIAGELTPVRVHLSRRPLRRAVVELPGGRRLTPSGRLLSRSPRLWTVRPRQSVLRPVQAELRQRARAGDAGARERLVVLLEEVLHERPYRATGDPTVVPVPSIPRRTRSGALRRRLWAVPAGALLGFVSAGPVGAVVAAPAFKLLDLTFWAWYGADVE